VKVILGMFSDTVSGILRRSETEVQEGQDGGWEGDMVGG
jgi:hypothetical protein